MMPASLLLPAPMPLRRLAVRQTRPVAAAAFALALVVLLADLLTPLGYAEWALYLVPVALTLFQPMPWLPYAVALASTVGTVIGWQLSPSGIAPEVALTNRFIGIGAGWGLAYIIDRVLQTRASVQRLLWQQQGKSAVAKALLGEMNLAAVGDTAVQAVARYAGAQVGALYRLENGSLVLGGAHAARRDALPSTLVPGEGLVGDVARSGRASWLHEVPPGHLDQHSALGISPPRHLLIAPVHADGQVAGVIELGFAELLDPAEQFAALLEEVSENVGIALRTAVYRQRLVELVGQTQRQSAELQAQQEELRVSNEELEERARALQESQVRLETQQQSLEQTNVQLEEQAQALQRQKAELESAKHQLERNAEELRAASQYKSEFLANMSHELRTPLNSALILSKLLADNRDETLTSEQVRYAQAIHDANNDLLALINDILDLSKIEAGRVDLVLEPVGLPDLVDGLRTLFEPLTRHKGLRFAIDVSPAAPQAIVTDPQRLRQVLKNLLANAVKFTAAGEVSLQVSPDGDHLRFEVRDTGIGIPKSQQGLIFEAFRQADGGTSRRFGGTGLGLAISQELARRLGGRIGVDSEPGRGSSFWLVLPRDATGVVAPGDLAAPAPSDTRGHGTPPLSPPVTPSAAPALPDRTALPPSGAGAGGSPSADVAGERAAVSTAPAPTRDERPAPAPARVADDRDTHRPSERLILVIEDDARFAEVLVELSHEMHFDCIVAPTAAEGLQLAREQQPSAVLLDIGLPDASGLSVLEQLKGDPRTRHVPVHVMSAHDRSRTARELGAIGYLLKPVAREELQSAIARIEERMQQTLRRVLVVEDDAGLRENLRLLLAGDQVEVVTVGRLDEALGQLAQPRAFDCVVMDLMLPDGSGYDLLERMAEGGDFAFPPVIVYTGRALTRDEEERLRRYSRSIIIKGARSPERLLDEVTLFLHSVESALPADQQRMLKAARRRDAVLDGRRILLAEDDVRNIFALASVFEPLGAKLEIARNGREALDKLGRGDIDLVLMDIMMPEMDGLEAMRRIRAEPRWAQLPIIALTAKAMADDRERCLEAGANDYIAKPIDVDKLVSLTRVWCPK